MTVDQDIETQALGWFVRLNDADAPASDWIAFEAWIAQDAAHRDAYDAVEQVWAALDDASIATPSAQPAANDDAPSPRAPAGRRRSAWLYPSIAAAAAAVLAISVWPQFSQTRMQVYRTSDDPRAVDLPDGSHVYLNRHSELRVSMKGSRRAVTLGDGEAAFDVAHDAARPFVIQAGDHEVRVLGTAFNVVNHADRFSVSVERGLVAVTPSQARDAVRLTAGQKIEQTGAGSPVLSRIDAAAASTWRKGVLVYRDAPLSEVGADLSRYFDKTVRVSASAQDLRFTGALQVGEETAMLDQLQDFVAVDVSRSSSEVRLTRRERR